MSRLVCGCLSRLDFLPGNGMSNSCFTDSLSVFNGKYFPMPQALGGASQVCGLFFKYASVFGVAIAIIGIVI